MKTNAKIPKKIFSLNNNQPEAVAVGLKFTFLCFNLIIIHYHSQRQRKIKLNQGKIEAQLSHLNYVVTENKLYNIARVLALLSRYEQNLYLRTGVRK